GAARRPRCRPCRRRRSPPSASPAVRRDRSRCASPSRGSVAVALARLLENDRLRLDEVAQPLGTTLAADARLLEPAEGHAEVGAERVAADRGVPQATRD